jgi:hypothetical protein
VKQRTVEKYARRFALNTLIETGTYLGEMVEATKDTFIRIFSIELDGTHYQRAKEWFSGDDHISIIQGDSGKVLPDVIAGITQPCLFWLDGHYSEGNTARGELNTPIIKELNHIFNHPVLGHVILIDDARCFIGQNEYPAIDELREMAFRRFPNCVFKVEDDIIRIYGRNGMGQIMRRLLNRVVSDSK